MKVQSAGFKGISWQGCGLLLVSAASLCFEINLTRLFSVSQFYHFAFMVVSIALLGYGASGTFLSITKIRQPVEELLPWLAGGSGACMLGSYLLVNHLPFDSFSMAIDPSQTFILLVHFAALSSPFFFCGMIVSLMLAEYKSSSGTVYSFNLLGSAGGCLAVLFTPSLVGGEGVVVFSTALAEAAGILFAIGNHDKSEKKAIGASVFLTTLLTAAIVLLAVRTQSKRMPGFFELRISPYKSISYALQYADSRVLSSQWNSFSKVDVVGSSSLHSIPGLSYRYLEALPQCSGLFVDGDNLNPILSVDADVGFTEYLPAAAAFRLLPGAEVLILEPRGGMDILAALALGAKKVTAVESNPLIIEAANPIYHLARVDPVNSSGRSYLRETGKNYDVILIPLTDSYHPVNSGAYSLGEDYRYTVEAVSAMLDRLQPDGILVITRWLQQEPSEWLRVFTLAVTALEKQGLEPRSRIIAYRGYNTGTLLIKKSEFQESETAIIRQFAQEKAFDLVYAPNLKETETNRYNILPEPVDYRIFLRYLNTLPRSAFYTSYRYDVRPPTDDHPFFGHYFKWSQLNEILNSLGKSWQPFGGAGYLVIILIFALALLLAAFLILLPAALAKKTAIKSRQKNSPLYFGLIGLAFMLIEMPFMQRFILYLDQPAFSITAVLFCILLFSGLGSHYGSLKLPIGKALICLSVLLLLYILFLPTLLNATLGLDLALRMAITVLVIAPAGFLMGIPFPAALSRLHSTSGTRDGAANRWLVTWVWAVNGACSVVASILAALLSISFGFTVTTAVGAGFYLLAWLSVRK